MKVFAGRAEWRVARGGVVTERLDLSSYDAIHEMVRQRFGGHEMSAVVLAKFSSK